MDAKPSAGAGQSSGIRFAAVTLDTESLLAQCQMRFTRRGGPGGQHRNKVSTAVELTHTPSGVTAGASERRSQADNRAVAVRRLRIELALHIRDDVTAQATDLVTRYGGGQLRVASDNDDFPIVLADIINRINAGAGRIDGSAKFWNTSTSQIIRLLRQHPAALQRVNELRNEHQLHRLR